MTPDPRSLSSQARSLSSQARSLSSQARSLSSQARSLSSQARSLSSSKGQIVLATHNPHKVEEFQAIVAATRPDLAVIGYDGPEPVEDGVTFAENALIKARAAAAHTGLPALADDSGVCVDVLGGSPGVFSAYWAGHAKDAAANLNLLLDQISDIADPHRTAQFVSTIALVVPSDEGGAPPSTSSRASGRGGSPRHLRAAAGSATTRCSCRTGRRPVPSAASASGRPRRRTRHPIDRVRSSLWGRSCRRCDLPLRVRITIIPD